MIEVRKLKQALVAMLDFKNTELKVNCAFR